MKLRICLAACVMLALASSARAETAAPVGLLAEYDDGAAKVVVVVPGPHLSLREKDSAHPAVKPAFRAVFTGSIKIPAAGAYRFHAAPAILSVDGKAVGSDPVTLTAGQHALRIEYRRPAGKARLQVEWESKEHAREPLPPAILTPAPAPQEASLWRDVDRGRALVLENNCRGCHDPAASAKSDFGRGPHLTGIGSRTTAAWIYKWLEAPNAWRANAHMPKLALDDGARRDVAAFLVTAVPTNVQAAKNEPSEERETDLRKRGKALYETVGCTACHGEGPGLTSLRAVGSKMPAAALRRFLQNPHEVDPTSRMPSLVTAREASAIAAFLVAGRDAAFEAPPPAGGDAARGRGLVASSGCLGCHALEIDEKPMASALLAPSWKAVTAASKAGGAPGCLSEAPTKATIPRFRLTPADRAAIAAHLAHPDVALAPAVAARATMAAYRCQACHEVEGGGAPFVTFKDHPPSLIDTGNKLSPSWVREVLTARRRMRHWMDLKMPHFPALTGLADGMAAMSGATLDDPPAPPKPDAFALREGVRYLGRGEEGLACINCHDFGSYKSGAATPAPDMATMAKRMRPEWFRRWLLDPMRIQPGTQMPAFFSEVERGIADQKINALWSALSLGRDMPLPEGVVLGQQAVKLAVDKTPVVMRTFVTGAGPRAIVVGFPGGQGFAFDADQGRLAFAWEGEFIDVRPSWYERGGQKVIPLGKQYYIAPEGSPFRLGKVTTTPVVTWRGYELDKDTPVFVYDVGDVHVRERIAPLGAGPKELGIARTLELSSKRDREISFVPGPARGVVLTVEGAAWDGTRAHVRLRRGQPQRITVRVAPLPAK